MQPEETPIELPVVSDDAVVTASPERFPFWGWLDFALVVGLFIGCIFFIFVVVAVAMLAIPSLKTNPLPLLLPSQLALYVAIYTPLFIVLQFRYARPVFSSLGWRRNVSNRTLLLCALGGALLSPAIALIASQLHTPEVEMDMLVLLRKSPLLLALFGVTAVTLGPIFEELLFRGFMQPLFSRTLGVVGGILLTAVLFGVLHSIQYKYVWQYVAAVSIVGVVLGVVRYRTASLIPSTVMHACFNLVASSEIFFHHTK